MRPATKFCKFFEENVATIRGLVELLYETQNLLTLRYAGPGIGFHSLLKMVAGSGAFLLSGFDSNARRATMLGLRRNVGKNSDERFASLTVAAGHSAAARFEGEQMLWEDEEQDRIPHLLSIGIAGAIRSKEEIPRDGFCAHITLRYLKQETIETSYISLRLPTEGMTRDDHENFVALVALNMLLKHTGIKEFELPSFFGVTSKQAPTGEKYTFTPQILKTKLTEDLLNDHKALIQFPNGNIVPLTREVFDPTHHVLVASAVNPVTVLHDHLGQMAVLYPEKKSAGFIKNHAAFVLNRSNANPKKRVSWDEFLRQVNQFIGIAPVIILNGFGTFASQAELFVKLLGSTSVQVIGGDKLGDIIQYPGYTDGLEGAFKTLKTCGQLFLVVDRGEHTFEKGRALCPNHLLGDFDKLFKYMPIAFAHFSDRVSSTNYREFAKLNSPK